MWIDCVVKFGVCTCCFITVDCFMVYSRFNFSTCLIVHVTLIFALTVIYRYPVGGEMKYAAEAQELTRPERNTLLVSFEDIERYNQQLATTVLEEYYR